MTQQCRSTVTAHKVDIYCNFRGLFSVSLRLLLRSPCAVSRQSAEIEFEYDGVSNNTRVTQRQHSKILENVLSWKYFCTFPCFGMTTIIRNRLESLIRLISRLLRMRNLHKQNFYRKLMRNFLKAVWELHRAALCSCNMLSQMKVPAQWGTSRHISDFSKTVYAGSFISLISEMYNWQKIHVFNFIVIVTYHVSELVILCCCLRQDGMLCSKMLNTYSRI